MITKGLSPLLIMNDDLLSEANALQRDLPLSAEKRQLISGLHGIQV